VLKATDPPSPVDAQKEAIVNKTTKVTQAQFADLLDEFGGCAPITLSTDTQPSLKKTGNPYRDQTVRRIARSNGFVGGTYESIANNKREKAGGDRDFEARSLPWGQHAGRYLIEHKGNFYLKFFPRATIDEQYVADEKPIPRSAIEEFLPKPRENRGGVPWITLKLASIRFVTFNTKSYELIDAGA